MFVEEGIEQTWKLFSFELVAMDLILYLGAEQL